MGEDLLCTGIGNGLKQAIQRQSARFEVQTAVTVKCDTVQSGRDVPMVSINKHMMT